ncbi:MAG TPA: SDR family NAD(P)-dependent oxidoreductase [Acetivibrio sp.]|uniref:SDR family NAD(P)-dependent oxidoreductase n=1 Tax=Acetivibrio sp. TaxID=1872092 RepID=UPI002B6339EF|nr:SDR family NAD(P)-dependent oxidoreductase [Acetivibrio sp.]HOM01630.1 SDR family NAD(P)-dependent oxidoreductase [Acetivibrio sp.]
MKNYFYPEERIAIVGMGALLPDANNVDSFWSNILSKKVSIREVPENVLNPDIYYDRDAFRKINKKDKTYTRVIAPVGVDDYTSLSRKFKIPPAVAEHMDPNQHVAIYCVDQALQSLANSNINKERTAVIMNIGAPGIRYNNIIRRTYYAKIEHYLRNNPKLNANLKKEELDEVLNELSNMALAGTIPITEDSAPGMLQSITASRISNLFDLYGPAYTVDAACASSLAALISGITGLLRKDYDVLITGGVDVSLDESPFVVFSAINALSPTGSYPFDSRANGFVIGLGGGVLILKRLEDALRDNDRIYALISGFGQGSDGKGKYIAAPNEEGQLRVIKSALEMTNYSTETIEYIEAHGTGTTVGDVVEIKALKKAFEAMGVTKKNFCGISSVKSNIGHLRYAAGSPGLIKAAMAIYNKILPPTANVETINPKLEIEDSPFYILTEKKQWRENSSHPRRANVSAYGFGGADYCVALEEFRPEFLKKTYAFSGPAENAKNSADAKLQQSSVQEVVLFSGSSIEEIGEAYRSFVEENKESSDFEQLVFYNNSCVSAKKEYRLAICACSMDELKEKYQFFEEFVKEGKMENLQALNIKGIYFGKGDAVTPDKVAWMFPGQASQYPNMLKSIYESYPQVESLYMQADAAWKSKYGYEVTSLVFGDDEENLQTVLKDTKNTHPVMFLSNIAMFKLLSESGIKADFMIGHSLGEITALHASGMLDLKSALTLIGERGFAFDGIPKEDRGVMMSIKADKLKVEELIKESGLKVFVANLNSPEQTVVGGREDQIDGMTQILEKNKITYTKLNVSHAFHTELVAGAAESYYEKIKDMAFDVPKAHVMACHRMDFYPEDKEKMSIVPSMLKEQIVSSVNFTESVLKLYEKGVRVFVEAGPSSVLTNLVKNILQGKDVKVVASNNKRKNAVDAYKQALAELFAYGMDVSVLPSGKALKHSKGRENVACEALSFQAEMKAPVQINVNAEKPCDKESLVYSGVSVGLPGTFKKVFSDDNFDLIFEGKNLIERLTDDEANSILDLNITRLLKTEAQATFKKLASINEVIQLAGKLGKIDMLSDYQIDEKVLKQMTMTVCAGVAAGYEALKDAGIPLIKERIKTSCGSYLPGRLVLPEYMQDDTGIIYANGFFPIETWVDEVSKYVASKFARKTRNDLIDFYESVISKVSDYSVKKYLTDWFNLHYSRLMYNCGEEEIYEFNHEFLYSFCLLANNRLAQFIGAMGPNFFVSAACSSTITAVTVAEDLIRAGHARRIIVIGAENVTSKSILPWSAGSFLSMGALTTSSDVFEAAVPFDNRRNGMILGAGAVGLVIEKESDVAERGMNGICRILGTHVFNTAGHPSKIDNNRFSVEFDRFMTKMEQEHGFDRRDIAKRTVYYSHETFSPRKGGCASAEKAALEGAFGSSFREIKVINTKGMTGHTMGASIEEAVAAKALQYQKIPPVANFREPDPDLEGLNLSQGGSYSFDYVIRMVTGYGAQGNYHLLQKIADGDERILDREVYQRWLDKITGSKNAKLEKCGRILVAEGAEKEIEASTDKAPLGNSAAAVSDSKPSYDANTKAMASYTDTPKTADGNIVDQILEIYSEITRYPKDMLDLNMEIEADLGIDTVKQATILSIISEKFNIPQEDSIKLSNYPTIGHVVNMVQARYATEDGAKKESTGTDAKNNAAFDAGNEAEDVEEEVFKVISEITKYPVEILERNMEMEADLGIDTVKQATIFSILSEKFDLGQNSANISQYKTVGSIVDLVKESRKIKSKEAESFGAGISNSNTVTLEKATEKLQSDKEMGKPQGDKVKPIGGNNETDIEEKVLRIISEITKYPAEMLERDMEMEADLGIDTVKQATIFSLLNEEFDIGKDERVNISDYKTIGSIIDLVKGSFKKAESILEDVKDEVAAVESIDDEDIVIEKDLCLMIPVFVEKQAEGTDFELKDKKIWIVGDNDKQVQKAAQYFAKLSAGIEEFVFENFGDAAELENKAFDFVGKNTKVDAIVDCTHLGTDIDFDKISDNELKKMLFLSSEARFIFYKALSQKQNAPEIRIVCAISMDGCHGYCQNGQIAKDPFYGALSGIYKGLGKEWGKSKVKIVDLGPGKSDVLKDEDLSVLAQELRNKCDDWEIGYCEGKRGVIKLKNLDRASFNQVNIPENAHFVITGGGNGITSEITKELSRRFKGKYTIIGRTELLDDFGVILGDDEASLNNIKLEIQKRLEKANKKVTPVMVQKEFDKLVKSDSIKKLLESIKKDGNSAEYLSCDVRNYEELKKALDKAVQENGPVHVLIHGAGVERSRLLSQKEREEFNEIFSVKAKGLCNLYRILDKRELKIAFAFSSISGRFGNEAQIDYCAANSFISSFMSMLGSTHKDIYSLSLAWSGWKDLGMAWRNEFVKVNSEEMGLHLIEPDRGANEFVNILTRGLDSKEVVISRGLGALANNQAADENLDDKPMIDWITKKDGKIEKVFKVVSVKRDAIFDHHRLGTVPLAPAVSFMELGAEALSLISGKSEQFCFRNINMDKPLKLFHEEPREVIALVDQNEGTDSIDVKLYTYLNSRFGISKLIGLNSMNVSNNLGEYSHLLEIMKIGNEPMEEDFTGEALKAFLRKNGNSINLGTLFIDAKKESHVFRRNKNGAVFSMLLPEEELTNKKYNLDKLLINPAFADSVFQICGVHSLVDGEDVYLPWQVDEFGVVKAPKERIRYKAYSVLKYNDEEVKVYDVIMLNEKNEVCYYAKNVKMRLIHS